MLPEFDQVLSPDSMLVVIVVADAGKNPYVTLGVRAVEL